MSSHRWQPFNSKREAWVVLTCQEGTTKHPYEHKHTHAKRREHLMCLLFVRSNNLVVLLDKNNSPKCHQRDCVFRNSITNVIIIFANMKFLAKNFAIIIIFRKNNASFDKRKTPQISDLQRFVDFELWFKWCHQGLMYPCKHLYLNALPLAYIKKPRDWHV